MESVSPTLSDTSLIALSDTIRKITSAFDDSSLNSDKGLALNLRAISSVIIRFRPMISMIS